MSQQPLNNASSNKNPLKGLLNYQWIASNIPFFLFLSLFNFDKILDNKINKFLVVNYRHSHKNVEQVDVAQSYFYDSEEDIKFIILVFIGTYS